MAMLLGRRPRTARAEARPLPLLTAVAHGVPERSIGWALTRLGEHASVVLIAALIAGALFPSLGGALPSALTSAAVLIVLGSFLTASASDREPIIPRLVCVVTIVATGALPCLLVWSVTAALSLPEDLATGMVLAVVGPPITGAAALAGLLGLAPRLALAVSLPLLVLSPLWLPVMTSLSGVGVASDAGCIAAHLAVIIGVAAALAGVVRTAGSRSAAVLTSPTAAAGVSVIGLALVAVTAAGTAWASLEIGRLQFAGLLWIALAVGIGLWLAGALMFSRLGSRNSMTIGFLFANRNQSLIWAAAGSQFSALAEAYVVAAIILSILVPSALRLGLDARDHLRMMGARLHGS